MNSIVVGILGMAPPASPVRLPCDAILKAASEDELAMYHGTGGTTEVAYTAWLEPVLIFIPAREQSAMTVLDTIEAVLQLSVNAAIGLWVARDGDVLLYSAQTTNVSLFRESKNEKQVSEPAPDSAHVQTWAELWASLPGRSTADTTFRIQRAMQRYQRALQEQDEEAIFHLVAACEAIVAPEHKEGGRQKRFVTRMSKLVAERPSQRSKIERVLKGFWRRRSGFAHGDHSLPEESPETLRKYAHQLISAAVEDPLKFSRTKLPNLG